MAVRMELTRILIRETSDEHIVELREAEGDRAFAMEIGLYEAAAIERRLRGEPPRRPQTHELLANILAELGAEIDHVLICDLREEIYFARLILNAHGKRYEIDARPSDAIALGVSTDRPIFMEEEVLKRVAIVPEHESDDPDEA